MSSFYMIEAIEYAKMGSGFVYNRPLLGVIIVKNKEIIATGYSKSNTINEGIIDTINNAKEDLSGSTMYLNIEPFYDESNTYAIDLIINNEIKCLVIGSYDCINTYKAVNVLRENKVQVIDEVLDKECIRLNEVYFKYITKKQPYLMMKYSMTIDGRIHPNLNFKNKKSIYFLNYIRKKVKCFIIGVDYLIHHENDYNEYIDKILVILDPYLKIPINIRTINMEKKPNIILITENIINQDKINQLEFKNIEIMNLYKNHIMDLHVLINRLNKYDIDSILFEGISPLRLSETDFQLIDKIYATIIPKLGDESEIQLNSLQLSKLDEGIMFEGYL